jgi:uncharacterized membrane protein YphA (DoxX/SURF4 family)
MLTAILAHYATVVAFLVAYGELAIGLSLAFGILSRLASVFGFVLMMLLWFSGGYPGAHSELWSYWAASESWTIFALCFLVLVAGRSEEVWSLKKWKKAGPIASDLTSLRSPPGR